MNLFGSGTVDYDTGNISNQGFLNKAVGALGSFVQSKPEQFAIVSDMVGSKLAPNNPFSGVGSYLAKSSLASKAAEKGKNKLDLIQQLISGLTEGNKPGGNNITLKRDANGNIVVSTSSNLKLEDLQGATKTSEAPQSPEASLDYLQSLAVSQ
jgi:hypothetical protein